MNKRTLIDLLERLPIRDDEPVYLEVALRKPKIAAFLPLKSVDHDPEIGVQLGSYEEGAGNDDDGSETSESEIIAHAERVAEEVPRAGSGPGY
jgi:hypothetical protein